MLASRARARGARSREWTLDESPRARARRDRERRAREGESAGWSRRGRWALGAVATLWIVFASRGGRHARVDASGGGASSAFCARGDPLVCAHGGVVVGDELANTRATLERALATGVECVEIDVARTKDGELVAMHGRDVVRFSRGELRDVGEVTRDELEMWNEGDVEALDFERAVRVAAGRGLRQITIDFKENAPLGRYGLAAAAIEATRRIGCAECVFWGKDDETIRDAIEKGAASGYVIANFSREMRVKGYDKIRKVRGARTVAVQSEMLSPALVRRARRDGLAVHVWTVNDEKNMRRVLAHGVDGILTDRPRELKALITSLRKLCDRE